MRRGKSPQNINEEVNKMRRLMNFDISQNSHDVLSESIIEKSVLSEQLNKYKNYKIINNYNLSGKETRSHGNIYLGDEIGEISQGVINFSENGKKFLQYRHRFSDWDDKTEVIKLLNTLISNELVKINEISDGKSAYEKSLEAQERERQLQTYDGEDAMFAPKLRGRKDKKGSVDLSAQVAEKRIAYFKTKGLNIPGITDDWADLEMGLKAKLGGNINIFKEPEPDPKDDPDPDPVSIDINFKLSDPYVFDSVELSDKGERQYQNFLNIYNETKEDNSDKWVDYIKFLKTKTPLYLNAFSSKDGNPDTIVAKKGSSTTTYKDCRVSGGRTRESYDKCLSEARAKEMVKRLETDIPELKGVFTPVGKGYKISSNSWTEGKTNHNSKNTAKDRYFNVVSWPSYTYEADIVDVEKENDEVEDIETLFDVNKHPQGLDPMGEWEIGKELGIGNQIVRFWKAKNSENMLVLMDDLKNIFDSLGIDIGSKIHGYYGYREGGLNGQYKFKVMLNDEGVTAYVPDGPLFFKGWQNRSDRQQDVTKGAETEWHRAIVKGADPFYEIGWVNFTVSNNENRRGRYIKK